MIHRHRPAVALIGFLLAVAIGAGIAYAAVSTSSSASVSKSLPPPTASLTVGSRPPAIDVAALRRGSPHVTSSGWRGKPVVLNFFASWCHPCKQELPLLSHAWRRHRSAVDFVGIDVNDSRTNALRLLRSDHVGYAIGADPNNAVTVRYGLSNLPTTVFINADGRVAYVHFGAVTNAVLNTWLPRLTR